MSLRRTLSSAESVFSRPRVTGLGFKANSRSRAAVGEVFGQRRAFAEEGHQHDFDAERFGDADAVGHAFSGDAIGVLEAPLERRSRQVPSSGDLLFLRFLAVFRDEFSVVHGHLFAGEGAADTDLDAIEAEFLGEGDRF